MKTNRSFIVSTIAIAATSLLTACGTVRQPVQQQQGSVRQTGLHVIGDPVEGRIVDANTNAITTHNVSTPLKQRRISDGGPAFDTFLYHNKVLEYGVQTAVNSFESISNLTSTAKFYGIDTALRDTIISRTAPQLTISKPDPNQSQPNPAAKPALGAPGFAPIDWGSRHDPALQQMRLELEALKAVNAPQRRR